MGKTLFSRFSKKVMAAALSTILIITSVSVAMFTVGAENVGVVANGGFEDGVDGYYKTSNLTYSIVNKADSPADVHSGEKSVKVQGKETWGQNCNLYQKVAVKPNTTYNWRFWYKSQDGMNKVLVGVREEDGDYLLPSSISSNGGSIDTDFLAFEEMRGTEAKFWHKGMTTTEWKEYVITFSTLDETAVWLTLNLWTQTRIGWTDDWSVEEVIPESKTKVIDGGFEEGVNNYKTYNLNYTVVNKTDSPADVHGGEKAVKVQGKGNWGQNCNLYQKVEVDRNTYYTWRFWYKAQEGSSKALVGVRDESGDYLMPSSITTDGGEIDEANSAFTEKRDTAAKFWHQGMTATEWKEYSVTFNSGDQTAVWLTLNLWTDSRVGWTDDWSIEDLSVEAKINNGGFENDLTGYQTTATLVSNVVNKADNEANVHSGSKAVWLSTNSASISEAYLYQKVELMPDTYYRWKFWYKSESGNNALVGVRTADGAKLLPSTLTANGDYFASGCDNYNDLRDAATPGNWHQGLLATEWQEYTISFYSDEQASVLLTLNLFTNARKGWTDDWSIEEVDPHYEAVVANGDFEADLTGYQTTATLTPTVVTSDVHGGSKAVKVEVNGGTGTALLYQAVQVKPDTYYKWRFWYKAEDGKNSNVLAGVRTQDGTRLLPSSITTEGGNLSDDTKEFSDSRVASSAMNWHQGMTTTGWREYSITFYSDKQYIVLLTLNPYTDSRVGYTDDWSIGTDIDAKIINGGFENGVNGYSTSDTVTAAVATEGAHGGEKAAYLTTTASASNAYFYQNVAVKPETDYKWKFWYKAETGFASNVLAGVLTEDGKKLLSSTITTDGEYIASGQESFNAVRDAAAAPNWHQGLNATEWQEYTITFNSGDQTNVSLALNLFHNNRKGWTDDWSIEEPDNNILTNPGFEEGASEFTADGATIAVDTSNVLSGANALKITGQGKVTRKVKINPHNIYTWKFYATSDVPVGFAVATADGTTLLPSKIKTVIGEGAASPEAFENERADGYHLVSSTGGYTQYAIEFDSGMNEEILLVYNADSSAVAYTDDWYLYGVIAEAYEEIFNPGFEEECVDYYVSDTRLTFSPTETDVHSGKRAMLIKNTTDGKGEFMQTVKVQKNSDYIWTFWLKFNNAATPIGAFAKDASNTTVFSEIGANEGSLVQAAADWHRIRNIDNEWHQYKLMIHTGNTDVLKLTLYTYAAAVELITDDWNLEYVGATPEKNDVLFNIDFEKDNMGCLQTNKGVWTVTDTESHSGKHSIKYDGRNDMNAYHMLYFNEYGVSPYFFKVEKNTAYRISFWYKCTGDLKRADIKACVTDPKGIVDIFNTYGAENEEWNYYETVLDTGDLTTLYFQIWPGTIGSGVFNMFVDDIKAEKVNPGISDAGTDPDEMECKDSENLIESALRNTELTSNTNILKKLELTPYGIYNFAVSCKADGANAQIGLALDENGTPFSDKIHGGSNAVKLGATGGMNTAFLTQSVTVEPNTDYTWKFWYKSVSGNNALVGVRTSDGSNLLPSTITTEGDYIASGQESFNAVRDAAAANNWHQGLLASDWHEYTVSFNSGDQTAVLLTLNLFYNNRIGWTDDWSIQSSNPNSAVKITNGGFEDGLTGYQTTDTLDYEVVTEETGILQFTDTNGQAEKKGFTFTAPEDGVVYLVMNNTSGTAEIEELLLYSLLPTPAKPKTQSSEGQKPGGNAGASIWDEEFDFDFDWNLDQDNSMFDTEEDEEEIFDLNFGDTSDNDDDSVQTSQGKKYRQIRKRVLVSKGQPGISALTIVLICVGAVLVLGAGTFVIILFARKKRR